MKKWEIEAAAERAAKAEEQRRQRNMLLAHVSSSPPRELALVDVAPGGRGIAWRWNVNEPVDLDQPDAIAKLVAGGPREADYGNVLPAFIGLAEGTEADAMVFVRRFGPLLLCDRHQLPFGHSPDVVSVYERDGCHWQFFNAESDGALVEWHYLLLSDLRDWSSRFGAIQEIAQRLRSGVSGGTELWVRIEPWVGANLYPPITTNFSFVGDLWWERQKLGLVIDLLIRAAGLRPVFDWDGNGRLPQVQLGARGFWSLAAAVTRELMFDCAQINRARFCINCGELIAGKYAQKYCRKCGKKAADRDSKRRQRATP